MSRTLEPDEQNERLIRWPDPRPDPDEEPTEPWAQRLEERLRHWKGWDEWLSHGK